MGLRPWVLWNVGKTQKWCFTLHCSCCSKPNMILSWQEELLWVLYIKSRLYPAIIVPQCLIVKWIQAVTKRLILHGTHPSTCHLEKNKCSTEHALWRMLLFLQIRWHESTFTDNNPLTYVLSSAKLNATRSRWVADFHFTIRYRPGKENVDADSLSRMPVDIELILGRCAELTTDYVAVTIQAVETQDSNSLCVCPVITSHHCICSQSKLSLYGPP